MSTGLLERCEREDCYGITRLMNVPQFARSVRGVFGMNSEASQMLPLESATAAE